MGLFLKPLGSDCFVRLVRSFAHGEGFWHCYVVLALAPLWYHVLLLNQLLFKISCEAPLDIFRVLIFKSLSLSSGCVNILNGETTELYFFVRSQFTASSKIGNKEVP